MAKHKSTRPTPQPQHKKSQPSRHDRRARLNQPNPNRQHTTHALVPLIGALAENVQQLATALDARLRQNSVQEKLAAEWIDHCLTGLGARDMQRV